MNRSLIALALAAAAALTATYPVVAQQTKPAATRVAIPKGVFLRGQQADQSLARTKLIGQKVYDRTGKIVADVEDLILDQYNQVVGVIVGTGGFLGAGEKKIGVRLSALEFGSDGKLHIPALTKEVIGALESYRHATPRKGIVDRVKEKAKEITDKTVDTTKDATRAAREQAGPAIDRAKEAAKEAYDKARDATKGAVERAKEAVQPK